MHWPCSDLCLGLNHSLTSFLSVLVVDQQCRAQVGHRDPRGHLQHADAAGGAGCWAAQAEPCTCEPDGSPDHGGTSIIVTSISLRDCFTFPINKSHCCVFLFQALNPDNEYHFKNRMKSCQRNWAEVFGDEANMFAVSPSNTYQKVRVWILLCDGAAGLSVTDTQQLSKTKQLDACVRTSCHCWINLLIHALFSVSGASWMAGWFC